MRSILSTAEVALVGAVAVGSLCWLATLVCALFFRRAAAARRLPPQSLPPLSLLKPVCGLEKNLAENLRTACLQDYPDYQVVYSVQRLDDPAIPLLRRLEAEFGSDRVTVALENVRVGLNGKINNLAGALPYARHELLVISDSDVSLRPDFLSSIVAPLADSNVGAVSTYFRATEAQTWYERMELLTLNADQFALAMLVGTTGLVSFCFGASTALTKQTLAKIGGLEGLGDYLVEDNEMGQRILKTGKKLVVIPYVVDTMVDLQSPAQWWQKQTYWDQNTRAAIPALFLATIFLRTIPLGLVFAVLRGGDAWGLGVMAVAVLVRLSSAAAVLAVALGDRNWLRSIWLLPVKDVLSLFWFVRAFVKRTVVWRGAEMTLTRDGKLLPLVVARST